jgi:orotate phosphoribosyltransferase
MLARAFGKPMIYVRKAVKGHGLGSLIEGDLRQGARVLLAEDLITDAGSKLSFIDAIKNVGSTVDAVVVVFDRLQGGREALEAINISLLSITDMQITLDAAGAAGVIKPQELVSVRKYLESPRDWHRERNLAFSN